MLIFPGCGSECMLRSVWFFTSFVGFLCVGYCAVKVRVRVNFSGVVGVPVYVSSSCSFVVSWLLRVRLCFSGGKRVLWFFVVVLDLYGVFAGFFFKVNVACLVLFCGLPFDGA